MASQIEIEANEECQLRNVIRDNCEDIFTAEIKTLVANLKKKLADEGVGFSTYHMDGLNGADPTADLEERLLEIARDAFNHPGHINYCDVLNETRERHDRSDHARADQLEDA